MIVREMVLGDKAEAQRWLDKAHGGGLSADIFFAPGCRGVVVEDSRGAVFFARVKRASRFDVQFNPNEENGFRTAKAFKALEQYIDDGDFGEVLFDSQAPRLIECMERFDFDRAPGTFVRKTKACV